MNIFYVDHNPVIAAQCLVDKHVVKMVLESAQLLSTAHRFIDGNKIQGKSSTGRSQKQWIFGDYRDNIFYKATHINHPSAIWCRQSTENYQWLLEHFFALADEYTFRHKKIHKSFIKLGKTLINPPTNMKNKNWTPMPSCMDEEYIISDNPVTNYRNYYNFGKKSLHSWKKRQPPDWILK